MIWTSSWWPSILFQRSLNEEKEAQSKLHSKMSSWLCCNNTIMLVFWHPSLYRCYVMLEYIINWLSEVQTLQCTQKCKINPGDRGSQSSVYLSITIRFWYFFYHTSQFWPKSDSACTFEQYHILFFTVVQYRK